jgi:3'-phosphoadenosine 5'-phosphosulfate sulfotransferase (PAPS reductase)/FAD synthetase
MQNLLVPHVRNERIPTLVEELARHELPVSASSFARGAVACTGTEFCKLAITETKSFTRWLVEELEERLPGFEEQVRLNVTGCPNSCGQHWIADIGIEGKKVRVDGRLVDAYYFCLGGGVGTFQAIARPIGYRCAATEVPDAIERLLRAYQLQRFPHEQLRPFLARHSDEELRTFLAGTSAVECVERDRKRVRRTDWCEDDRDEVIAWGRATFASDVAIASSFGAEDVVLIDIGARAGGVRVFARYRFSVPRNVRAHRAHRVALRIDRRALRAADAREQAREHGEALWTSRPDVLQSAQGRAAHGEARELRGYRRVRREQVPTRANAQKIEWTRFGLVKLNLADWTWNDVWRYIHDYDVPYTRPRLRLPSIGCTYARAVAPARICAGRWAGTAKTEAGYAR